MMYVSFVILGYQTLDLKGESITPPPSPISVSHGSQVPQQGHFSCKQKRQDEILYIVNHMSSNKSSKGTVVNRALFKCKVT